MYKFRSKPTVIEAFQMTEERRRDNVDWPKWLHRAWNKGRGEVGAIGPASFPNSDGTDKLVISTQDGVTEIRWDDWIIKSVAGELDIYGPEFFAESYESVGPDCRHVLGLAWVLNSEEGPAFVKAWQYADKHSKDPTDWTVVFAHCPECGAKNTIPEGVRVDCGN